MLLTCLDEKAYDNYMRNQILRACACRAMFSNYYPMGWANYGLYIVDFHTVFKGRISISCH